MTKDVFEFQKSQNMPNLVTLEVEINKIGEKNFKLPNDIELANKTIIGLFITFPTQTGTLGRSGRTLLPIELMNDAYLTLTSCGKDFIKNAPLRLFDVTTKPLLYVPIYSDGLTLRDSEISLSEKLTTAIVQGQGGGSTTPNFVIQLTFVHL